jgi:hypothetical protein
MKEEEGKTEKVDNASRGKKPQKGKEFTEIMVINKI